MGQTTKRVIEFWRGHTSSAEHGWIHPSDIPILSGRHGGRVRWDAPTSLWDGVDEALADGNRVQAGLLPQPFVGDLRKPDVVVCLTNPGFGLGDYATERYATGFAEAKQENLRQTLPETDYPFFEIDPGFSATPAFGWWFPRLRPAIDCIAARSGRSRWEVAREVARRIVCVELFPYHSATAGSWLDGLVTKLPSSLAAQDYVRDRALAGTTVLICRRHRVWRAALRLEQELPNVVDVRGQTITFAPGTAGGDALIRGLGYNSAAS